MSSPAVTAVRLGCGVTVAARVAVGAGVPVPRGACAVNVAATCVLTAADVPLVDGKLVVVAVALGATVAVLVACCGDCNGDGG